MTTANSPRISVQFIIWLTIYAAILVWSYINPADRFTWWLEVCPTVIGVAIMALTYRRFPLSPLLYWIILVHSSILYIGGHYTYAEVPLPNIFGNLFPEGRNNFDKIGHFFQGVTPALIMRELLIRTSEVGKSKWLGFLSGCVALAFSAFYEFFEWWTAAIAGASSEAFLGTQGYAWDTQTDMFMAMIGATVAISLFWRLQNKQIAAIEARKAQA